MFYDQHGLWKDLYPYKNSLASMFRLIRTHDMVNNDQMPGTRHEELHANDTTRLKSFRVLWSS